VLWVVIWAVLVVLAGALFAAIGLSLWRKGKALAHELTEAAELLAKAQEQVQQLQRPQTDPTPAVFADPSVLRAERAHRRRHRSRRRRMSTSRAGG
jgi:type II secretory pathway pseudopilin PulG